MSMIPEVKCRRCGESFSSMRSRCPNCGTRRVAQSSRTPGTTPGTVKGTASYERAETNTKWQMIFGLILVVAVILAVIVMVSTSLNGADVGLSESKPTPPVVSDVIPTVETPPTPPPTPTPTVEKIEIRYFDQLKDEGWTMKMGDAPVEVNALVYPLSIQGAEITWTCSDESVLKITPSEDGTTCKCEIVGTINGGVQLTASCLGQSKTVPVYCVGN